MTVTKIALGVCAGILLAIVAMFAACTACGIGVLTLAGQEDDLPDNVDQSMSTRWQETYGVSRARLDLREPTPEEAALVDPALGADRQAGCGVYRVQSGYARTPVLRVRCSPAADGTVTEYIVDIDRDPWVRGTRKGRAP